MPSLNVPVLELDTSKISCVNTRNVESLYSLWTVFNKFAGSIEGGKGTRHTQSGKPSDRELTWGGCRPSTRERRLASLGARNLLL
jgi:hypothetical protein